MSVLNIKPENQPSSLDKLTDEIDSDPAFQNVVNPTPASEKNNSGILKGTTQSVWKDIPFVATNEARSILKGITKIIGRDGREAQPEELVWTCKNVRNNDGILPGASANLALALAYHCVGDAQVNEELLFGNVLSQCGFITDQQGSALLLEERYLSEDLKQEGMAFSLANGLLVCLFSLRNGVTPLVKRVREAMHEYILLDGLYPDKMVANEGVCTQYLAGGKYRLVPGSMNSPISPNYQNALASVGFALAEMDNVETRNFFLNGARSFVEPIADEISQHECVAVYKKVPKGTEVTRVLDMDATAALAFMEFVVGDPVRGQLLLDSVDAKGEWEAESCSQGNYRILHQRNSIFGNGPNPERFDYYSTITNAFYALALVAREGRV